MDAIVTGFIIILVVGAILNGIGNWIDNNKKK